MKLSDIEKQVKALAPVVRDYVAKAVEVQISALRETVDSLLLEISTDFSKRLDALPQPDVEQIAEQAAALIPAPKDGKDGENGKSITLEDVQEVISEAVSAAVGDIPLPKDGEKGEPGAPGEGVDITTVELMVEQAVIRAMEGLELPADGKDGRDALDIDILPTIDEEKAYPRGIWAKFRGGLWRSHATTSGLRGWEVIVNGVHSEYTEQVDERNFESVTVLTDGTETRKSLAVPVMIYRNIWKQGAYQRGDTVTWGGSLWHCNEDTDEKPGEASKHWQLAAKRGRDGNKPK